MPKRPQVFRKLHETLITLASKGNCIIIGRGASILTRNLGNGVHIRLIQSLNKRIENIMELKEIQNHGEAKNLVVKNQKEREAFVKEFTGKDTHDPYNYDMVINMDTFDPEETATIIFNLLTKILAPVLVK